MAATTPAAMRINAIHVQHPYSPLTPVQLIKQHAEQKARQQRTSPQSVKVLRDGGESWPEG
jgi:hypothetical protein